MQNNFTGTLSEFAENEPMSQVQKYHLQHQQLKELNASANANKMSSIVNNEPQSSTSDKNVINKNLNQKKTENNSGKIKTNKNDNKLVKNASAANNQIENGRKTTVAEEQNSQAKEVASKKNKNNKKNEQNCNEKVEQIIKLTKNLKITTDADAVDKKPSKKIKVKAPKFEYADPQYKMNKFDVLDLDDDDFYISEEEESVPDSVTVSPVTVKKDTTSVIENKKPESTSHQKPSNSKKNSKKNTTLASKSNVTTPVLILKEANNLRQSYNDLVATTNKNENKKQAQLNKKNTNVSKVSPTPQPLVPPVELSKKQKKKLAQQKAKLDAAAAVAAGDGRKSKSAKSITNAENMANSLNKTMQRLNLNDDTTIELVKENRGNRQPANQVPASVSIMDQLNNGVQLEGLQLPPGITLTRVDPIQAQQVRAKKESIDRVSILV